MPSASSAAAPSPKEPAVPSPAQGKPAPRKRTSAAGKAAAAARTPAAGQAKTAGGATAAGRAPRDGKAVAPKAPARKRAATRSPAAPALPDAERADIDDAVASLTRGAEVWAALSLGQRARLLRSVRARTAAVIEEWARTAAASKGLSGTHPLRGEEWLSGPYGVLGALDAAIDTLGRLDRGESPLDGRRLRRAPGDRIRVHAFPLTRSDRVLLAGFSGEVWLRPGVTPRAARQRAGLAQLTPGISGGVGLVLGAGNVTAIPVLDVLYELLAHNRVALLKVNPTQDALVPVLAKALAPLIELDLLRIVHGGAQTGAYLTAHPGFAHVHITGSEASFDAIVWGADAQAARRKRENRPRLKKPITAELGGVSPIIVVPGAWSAADIAFQAEHIATMRLQNCGHNCIAGQVVLLSRDWPQRERFLAALRRAYALAPERPIWYPGSADRMARAAEDYPDALLLADRLLIDLPGDGTAGAGDSPATTAVETTEYFAPVLGVVELPGRGQAFLDAAVAHANERLTGTLGANVLIDPVTERALGAGFERALARLEYGTIAVNTWTALGFLIPTLTWGAYPGSTLQKVGSGLGIVHNALLLDDVERTVVRGPFRPFPRMLSQLGRGGRFTILPTPPWFVSARTGAQVSEGLTRFRAQGRIGGLLKTLLLALRA